MRALPSKDLSLRVSIDTPLLRERTIAVLRQAILGLRFHPGEKLVERQLCEQTGVSRTCIREALRQLEAEGLVTRGHGVSVSEVDAESARQIYELRAILEPAMAVRFVERASTKQMDAVDKALKRIETTIFGKDLLAYAYALDGFFDAILAGADNELARQMLGGLRARITFLRTLTARAASREQRQGTLAALARIAAALRDREAAGAEALSRAFVERSAAFARSVIASGAMAAAIPNKPSPKQR